MVVETRGAAPRRTYVGSASRGRRCPVCVLCPDLSNWHSDRASFLECRTDDYIGCGDHISPVGSGFPLPERKHRRDRVSRLPAGGPSFLLAALALARPPLAGLARRGRPHPCSGSGIVCHASAWPRRFATRERNALLLYNGRFNEKHDFLALEIVDEQVQLTFSAGRASSGEQQPRAGLGGSPPPCCMSGVRPVWGSGAQSCPPCAVYHAEATASTAQVPERHSPKGSARAPLRHSL